MDEQLLMMLDRQKEVRCEGWPPECMHAAVFKSNLATVNHAADNMEADADTFCMRPDEAGAWALLQWVLVSATGSSPAYSNA